MEKPDSYTLLVNLIKKRYSCRNFKEKPVSRDTISTIIDAARLAPSACNRQPWEFIVIDTDDLRRTVIESYDRQWIRSAPAFIIACGLHDEAWHRDSDGKDHTDVDVSIAIEHICLAATALNLGTCWVCNFNTDTLRTGLNIPQNIEPIAIIPLGYPDTSAPLPEKKRKSLEDITKWGKY